MARREVESLSEMLLVLSEVERLTEARTEVIEQTGKEITKRKYRAKRWAKAHAAELETWFKSQDLEEWVSIFNQLGEALTMAETLLSPGKATFLQAVRLGESLIRKIRALCGQESNPEETDARLYALVERLFGEGEQEGDGSKRARHIPATFTEGYGSIMSNLLLWGVQQSIMKPDEWELDERGLAFYAFSFGEAKGRVQYKQQGVDDGLFFSRLPTLNLDTLDALSVMVNELTATGYADIQFSYRTIIEARGGKNRTKSTVEEAARWTKAINRATPLYLAAVMRQKQAKRGGKRATINYGGYLVMPEPVTTKTLSTGETIVYTWRVVPGNALLEMAQYLPYQSAVFPQSLIALDTKKEEMAKKLGYYFVWQFRIRADKPGQYERSYIMGHLLEAVGIKPPEDARHWTRFKGRIERHLDLLVDRRIVGNWQWVDDEPRKRDDWLAAPIKVWPTKYVLEHYSKTLKGARQFLSQLPLLEEGFEAKEVILTGERSNTHGRKK